MNLIRAAGKAAPLIKEWKEALIKLQGYARNEVAIPYAKAWNGCCTALRTVSKKNPCVRKFLVSLSLQDGRSLFCGIIPKSAGLPASF